MNKVTLIRLAVMDINVTYARRYEGGINTIPELDFRKRYDIEKIQVIDSFDENHSEYIKSYLESIPTVNKVASKMKV